MTAASVLPLALAQSVSAAPNTSSALPVSGFNALWAVPEVRTALIVGSVVVIATALVGVLTVLRGQSFAGHSLTDLASVGGSAAFLLGVNQLWGFVAASIIAALGMHAIGVERLRGRDVSTGIILATGMGLTSLFLSLSTMRPQGGSASVNVLFGSLFAISPSVVPIVIALSVLCLLMLTIIWRPALFSTVAPQLAHARGVSTGATNAAFMVVLALSVALSSISVGAVLSTALLIGPASCGLMLAKRVRNAMFAACGIGLFCVWGGIVISYESYSWMHGHSWSVSFCIVALVTICYLLSRLASWLHGTSRRSHGRNRSLGLSRKAASANV
ncbi:MAG: metal ABC transporter permease [Bifidobacterium tibiigranuli]|jgi:zinc/manganese transport system permease protein|uniref:metal ABC transporter permease n=1 Tax=Bifidobacterium tibiigranuli TaxID=2172043 RepID=UPI0026E9CB3F|nr:metal ABC transporter permease [Bifidobacterium tibiigranuli]MCI1674267.1 metal ABC transporter permease [Bifidobacterium tibiigranuli]MCI1713453.1 metal ABC transporter permease [Bifidobacterium tibiigranuli]MCI1834063.1 metal ABC transporter permease [Bifidobacterium tibiigranuli]